METKEREGGARGFCGAKGGAMTKPLEAGA
jgi:hypothetical protein